MSESKAQGFLQIFLVSKTVGGMKCALFLQKKLRIISIREKLEPRFVNSKIQKTYRGQILKIKSLELQLTNHGNKKNSKVKISEESYKIQKK